MQAGRPRPTALLAGVADEDELVKGHREGRDTVVVELLPRTTLASDNNRQTQSLSDGHADLTAQSTYHDQTTL